MGVCCWFWVLVLSISLSQSKVVPSTLNQRWRSVVGQATSSIAKGSLAASIALSPRSSSAAAVLDSLSLPECDDAITILRGPPPLCQQVVLIGTAHISEQSAALVRRTVQQLRPDVVMVELDLKRVGRVTSQQQLKNRASYYPLQKPPCRLP
jgi:hypothetical protein